ncbi:MAG: hemerythrin domain-containing protein [Hyphomicrobium sp.]
MTAQMTEGLDPIDVIVADHRVQLELCDILERIADGLPEPAERKLVSRAFDIIERSWRQHTEFEEQCLFPILRNRISPDSLTHDMLDQFEAEHASDRDVMREVVLTLDAVSVPRPQVEPVAVGYLLRSFFESQRRHIGWETAVVLPLLKSSLQVDDLKRMSDWLAVTRGASEPVFKISSGCKNCGGCACSRDIEAR